MTPIEITQYKGYTIEIDQDIDPRSPREWDNLGVMACFCRRYTLGDKHEFGSPDGFWEWAEREKPPVLLPLYLYDHNGISMSTGRGYPFNDPWDAGQVGWIYVTREGLLREYGTDTDAIECATKVLEREVSIYDEFLRGEVYGYAVKDESGAHIDSCRGYFGSDHDYMMQCGREIIDAALKNRVAENI